MRLRLQCWGGCWRTQDAQDTMAASALPHYNAVGETEGHPQTHHTTRLKQSSSVAPFSPSLFTLSLSFSRSLPFALILIVLFFVSSITLFLCCLPSVMPPSLLRQAGRRLGSPEVRNTLSFTLGSHTLIQRAAHVVFFHAD